MPYIGVVQKVLSRRRNRGCGRSTHAVSLLLFSPLSLLTTGTRTHLTFRRNLSAVKYFWFFTLFVTGTYGLQGIFKAPCAAAVARLLHLLPSWRALGRAIEQTW